MCPLNAGGIIKGNVGHRTQSDLDHPYRYYFKLYKKSFGLGLLFLVFSNIFDNLSPLLIGMVLDALTAEAPFAKISELVIGIIIINLLLTVSRYFWRIYWGRFHHSVADHLRNKVFKKMTTLGPSFYHKTSVGELMSLITNDVNVFRMAVGPGVLILVDAVLNLVIIVPLLFYYSPSWTWKTLIFLPIVTVLSRKILNKIYVVAKKKRDEFSKMSGETQELIAGIRVVKGYAKESIFESLYSKRSAKYRDASNQVGLWDAYFSPLMEFGVTTGAVMLLFIGAPEVLRGEVTLGGFFAFYQYLQRMVWPASAMGIGLSFHKQGEASLSRIRQLLDQPTDMKDLGSKEPHHFESLEFKTVSFTYPGAPTKALDKVSFRLNAGESLGIVGATGAGKSTLVSLICRLYPLDEGAIYMNDSLAGEAVLHNYRNLMAPVPQETFLFSQSIADNLKLGKDLSDIELAELARQVGIDQEIERLPAGYKAFLGEKGVNLSGGQKQRLALARALGRRAGLLVLDDSFSAVDIATERGIVASLKSDDGIKPAMILISHRIESLSWVDKILVLNEGRVEAYGHHDELIKESLAYKTLYNLQTREDSSDGSHLSG